MPCIRANDIDIQDGLLKGVTANQMRDTRVTESSSSSSESLIRGLDVINEAEVARFEAQIRISARSPAAPTGAAIDFYVFSDAILSITWQTHGRLGSPTSELAGISGD
jgi:hypothetical protein